MSAVTSPVVEAEKDVVEAFFEWDIFHEAEDEEERVDDLAKVPPDGFTPLTEEWRRAFAMLQELREREEKEEMLEQNHSLEVGRVLALASRVLKCVIRKEHTWQTLPREGTMDCKVCNVCGKTAFVYSDEPIITKE